MIYKFFSNLLKRLFVNKWDSDRLETCLSEILENEKPNITFPVLLIEEGFEKDFTIFNNPSEIIQESIASHWNGVTPSCSKIDAKIIDSSGKTFKIINEIYNDKHKICYSYPQNEIGKISLDELNNILTTGIQKHIEFFTSKDEDVQELEKTTELLQNAVNFSDVIKIAEKLENLK